MANKQFSLVAHISTASPAKIKSALPDLVRGGLIERTGEGFRVTGKVRGTSARELNRNLLSALRRIERKTRLRAEWTGDETTEWFFDYVPKRVTKA